MVIVGQFIAHLVTPFRVTNVWPDGQEQAASEVEPAGLVKSCGQSMHCDVPPVPYLLEPHIWHVPFASREKPGLHDDAVQVVFVELIVFIAFALALFEQLHDVIAVEPDPLVEPDGQPVQDVAPLSL